ncbi:unnamed protein product [Mesocestoides corti]|uniref:Uncharacterized protein n=2 Tax=Mesocestoides corti TaxID=53468 RepID=A0A0R3UD16_MESCO|nr:unnamed protein product [Mesocestoides corti]
MTDLSKFMSERLRVSNCAVRHFGAEELPLSLETCIDEVITWASQAANPPLAILAQRFLRSVLTLSSYEVGCLQEC